MSDHLPAEPSPDEASELLAHAARVGSSAVARVSGPHVAALVGLGAATSLGTLAMNMTTGAAYVASAVAMFVWVGFVFGGLGLLVRGSSALGFSRRWRAYIVAWAVIYGIAIVCATSELKGNLVIAAIASALIAIVTMAGAVRESRS